MQSVIGIFLFSFFNFFGLMQNNEYPILSGRTHERVLQRGETGIWFKKSYNQYTPDAGAMDVLSKKTEGLRFLVFAGSWCSDTHQWLPAFYRVTDGVGISRRNIDLYFADRNKVTPEGLENQYNIQRLPTFIILRGELEIGRITETPSSGSIERDLLAILGV